MAQKDKLPSTRQREVAKGGYPKLAKQSSVIHQALRKRKIWALASLILSASGAGALATTPVPLCSAVWYRFDATHRVEMWGVGSGRNAQILKSRSATRRDSRPREEAANMGICRDGASMAMAEVQR